MFIPGGQFLAPMALGATGALSAGNSGGTGGGLGGLYRRGGRVNTKRGPGDFLDTVHAIRTSLRRGGPVIDMRRDLNGIYVPDHMADGGVPDTFRNRFDGFPPFGMDIDPQQVRDSYFAANGADPAMFEAEAAAESPFANGAPLPMARPNMPQRPMMAGLPPEITGGGGQPIMLPPSASAYDGAQPPQNRQPLALGPQGGAPTPLSNPSPAPVSGGGLGSLFGPISEEARMGLMSAGLGMMASKSTNALGAIGEGGLHGVKTYADQKSQKQRVESEARRLAQTAEQFAKGHDLRERALSESERHHQAQERRAEEQLQRGKFTYLGPTADGTGSVFMDQKTGETEVRPLQIGSKTPAKERVLPSSVQKDLGEKAQAFATLGALAESFDPSYGGFVSDTVADLSNEAAKRGLPSLTTENAANWWSDYNRYKGVVRNKLFGSALTGHEIKEWNKFDVKPSQTPETIKYNIGQQKKIVERGLLKRAKSLAAQGYSKQGIEEELGIKLDGAGGGAKSSELKRPSTGDLDKARAAIKSGASKEAVTEYLREQGYSAEGL
jgi:hypothetical protein